MKRSWEGAGGSGVEVGWKWGGRCREGEKGISHLEVEEKRRKTRFGAEMAQLAQMSNMNFVEETRCCVAILSFVFNCGFIWVF